MIMKYCVDDTESADQIEIPRSSSFRYPVFRHVDTVHRFQCQSADKRVSVPCVYLAQRHSSTPPLVFCANIETRKIQKPQHANNLNLELRPYLSDFPSHSIVSEPPPSDQAHSVAQANQTQLLQHRPIQMIQPEPTIDLIHHIRRRIHLPHLKHAPHPVRDAQVHDLLLPLDEVHVQAAAQMPRDVAVIRPDAGVQGVCLDNEISAGLQEVDVAALRVFRARDPAVPLAHALRQDVHGVAVQVHRVRLRRPVVRDQPVRRDVAQVVDVPLRVLRVAGVAGVGEEEGRVVVVAVEGDPVHPPVPLLGRVLHNVDGDGEGE